MLASHVKVDKKVLLRRARGGMTSIVTLPPGRPSVDQKKGILRTGDMP